jgi:glutamine---fructose-6-phosphate transaminase (isomerizing)
MSDQFIEVKRCVRCLLPVTTPDLVIGSDGVCSVCRSYIPMRTLGEQALREELTYTQGNPSDYDCLVPISGGADSIYNVFYLKQKMGLRVLAVHYDHGLGSENKLKMLKWVEDSSGVKILYHRWEKEKTQALIRYSLRALLPYGPETMQAALCRQCGYGIRAAVFTEMVNWSLHSVWGVHPLEKIPFRYCEQVDLPHYLLQPHGLDAIQSLRLRYRQTREVPSPDASPLGLLFSQMGYPSLPGTSQNLKVLHLYSYIPWDKQRMIAELQECGIDTQALASAHSDCTLPPIVDHLLRRAWTIGKKEIYVSNMVREGLLTKEEGMTQIQVMRAAIPDPAPLREMGLSEQEIHQLLG